MNVLSFIIAADAKQFLSTLRGSSRALKQWSNEVQTTAASAQASIYNATREVSSSRGGGSAASLMNRPSEQIRVDWSGPQHIIKRGLDDAARSFSERLTGFVGKATGIAFSAGMAFDVGQRLGSSVRDFFDRINAVFIDQDTKRIRAETSANREMYINGGGFTRDLTKSRRDREMDDIDRSGPAQKFVLIDAAIARREKLASEYERTRREALAGGRQQAYAGATEAQARVLDEIEDLRRRRIDAEQALAREAEDEAAREHRQNQELKEARDKRIAAEAAAAQASAEEALRKKARDAESVANFRDALRNYSIDKMPMADRIKAQEQYVEELRRKGSAAWKAKDAESVERIGMKWLGERAQLDDMRSQIKSGNAPAQIVAREIQRVELGDVIDWARGQGRGGGGVERTNELLVKIQETLEKDVVK